jgi:ABC-type nitrate/sulfonate/bicarbonate transport system substrate-binding protein
MRCKRTILFLLILAACMRSNAAPVHAQKLAQIHIGVPTNTITWFPLYVAWKKGLFEEQGIEVLPVAMSVRASLGALAAKHISYITPLGSSMTAISNGLPAKVIMIFATKSHHVLVTKPEISTASRLRGRSVAISQPGGTVHRQLLKILEHHKIDPKEVKVVNLGEMPNRALALKAGNIDGAMLSIPFDLYLEQDGYKPLAYVKDVSEFPLLGLITHNDYLRERPDEIKRVLTAALKGIAYTKSHREDVLPLLRQFIGLPTIEMSRKAFEVVKELWPDNGLPSEHGLQTGLDLADVPRSFPVRKIVDWSILKQATASLKAR